ncbi:hypothetical protein [Alicyclobacillus fodiniaquatilis]|uniref:Uncharacterized protein n=1 Tax=Alicyclobacillus fodiniaquatilis TaxID=1661150 RepID=A0ABW4JG32_9BACL
MKITIKSTALLGLGALCIASLVINEVQYRQNENIKDTSLEYGFALAFSGINTANSIFKGQLPGQDTTDAVRYIARSAGQLESMSRVMNEMGIEHTAGIGVRLEESAEIISKPTKYSKEQVAQNKKFVEEVSTDFRPCFDGPILVKSRLPAAISKVYKAISAISPKERSQLYSM